MFVSDYYVESFLNVALETIDDKFFSSIEIPKCQWKLQDCGARTQKS